MLLRLRCSPIAKIDVVRCDNMIVKICWFNEIRSVLKSHIDLHTFLWIPGFLAMRQSCDAVLTA